MNDMKFTFFRNSKTGRYVPFEKEYTGKDILKRVVSDFKSLTLDTDALYFTPEQILAKSKIDFDEKIDFTNQIALVAFEFNNSHHCTEIIVTDDHIFLENMIYNIEEVNTDFPTRISIHLHNSFESAYKEALAMRETHPACYE
jgi:hypothetical protein